MRFSEVLTRRIRARPIPTMIRRVRITVSADYWDHYFEEYYRGYRIDLFPGPGGLYGIYMGPDDPETIPKAPLLFSSQNFDVTRNRRFPPLASLISAAVGALLEFDEVDVRMLDENTVEYKILTTGMMPEAIELKTLIWSYLSPPVKSLEITNIDVVERGFITNRYLVTVRGDVKGLPMARGKGPIRRWRRRLELLRPEE